MSTKQNPTKQQNLKTNAAPEDSTSDELQHARQIRRQPFCWQEKKVLRLIQKSLKGIERAKTLLLYTVLTWIDNDFNGEPILWYTKTIATYSGLDPHWIPKGLKNLQELNIIEVRKRARDEETGRFKEDEKTGAAVIFTPEKAINHHNAPFHIEVNPHCGKTQHKKKVLNKNKVGKNLPSPLTDKSNEASKLEALFASLSIPNLKYHDKFDTIAISLNEQSLLTQDYFDYIAKANPEAAHFITALRTGECAAGYRSKPKPYKLNTCPDCGKSIPAGSCRCGWYEGCEDERVAAAGVAV